MIGIEPALTLQEKEDEAHRYYLNTIENWRKFIAVVLDIKASGDWKQRSRTWTQYCEDHLPVSASRIRQLKGAEEIANMLESVTGVTPNEYQLRQLRSVVPEDDRHLLPEIYSRVHEATSTPTRKDYEATYAVLKERETTGGYVSIDGESRIVDITQIAVDEAIIEASKRQKQHITDNAKPKQKLTITLQMAIIDNRVRIVLPEDVPAWLIGRDVTLYIEDQEGLQEGSAA